VRRASGGSQDRLGTPALLPVPIPTTRGTRDSARQGSAILSPFVPRGPDFGSVEPRSSGLVIRVSGVRVPPPASEVPGNQHFLAPEDMRNLSGCKAGAVWLWRVRRCGRADNCVRPRVPPDRPVISVDLGLWRAARALSVGDACGIQLNSSAAAALALPSGFAGAPTATRETPARRPERARRQRRTRPAPSPMEASPDAHRRRDVADPAETVARTRRAGRAPRSFSLTARNTSRESARRAMRSSIPWHVAVRGRPGKGILVRTPPSLPRRPYEDGHLLQLERCHDAQQHSGGLATGGRGGHAPRRRVDWSCGSACRRWPGARSGAAC
jgi:hypothetical protein